MLVAEAHQAFVTCCEAGGALIAAGRIEVAALECFASSVVLRARRAFVGNENAGLVILELEFVAMAPVVLSPTEDRQATSGSDVVLEARATGTEPMAYSWFHGNTELDASSGPTLNLAQIGTPDLGESQF